MLSVRPPLKTHSSLASAAIVAAVIAAPAMGGSTLLWSGGALLIGSGLILCVFRGHTAPGWGVFVLVTGVLCAGVLPFLPAHWFPSLEWRSILEGRFGQKLPFSRATQPWLTLQAFSQLAAGVIWAWFLQSQSWREAESRVAVHLFCGGMALLAAFALGASLLGKGVPWWSGPPLPAGMLWPHSSFFPNRNQAADVLALAAVMTVRGSR